MSMKKIIGAFDLVLSAWRRSFATTLDAMLVGSGLIGYTLNLHVQNILIYGPPVSPGLHQQCTSTPAWGLCPVVHEASGFILPEWKRRFRPEHLAYHVAEPALLGI